MCHKTGVHNVLWQSLLCRRILPRSRENSRHLWDDTTPDKARATIIPWSSKLPADIHPSSQLKHWAPLGSPQKGELLCLGWEHQHVLPENKVPAAESPPETPEILWSEQTSHPPVWCLTQGARSLHHPGQTAHCFCKQVPHRHRDPLYQYWERTLGHHVWLWEIPHVPVQDIHHGDGP